MNYSNEIFDTVLSFMEKADIPHEIDFQNGIVRFNLLVNDKNFDITLFTDEGTFMIYATLPVILQNEQYASELLMFLNKLNFGLKHGTWILDGYTGRIFYRISVIHGCEQPESLIQAIHLVSMALKEQSEFLEKIIEKEEFRI